MVFGFDPNTLSEPNTAEPHNIHAWINIDHRTKII